MSLENLFIDRKARKSIRESILEAPEIGKGVCEMCSAETLSLIKVKEKCLCESCCNQIMESTYDYDKVFDEADIYSYCGDIDEAYVSFKDVKKLQDDAKNKFNDSIPDLLDSYGVRLNKDWAMKWDKGMLYVPNNYVDTSTIKSKFNQFLIDYEGELPDKFKSRLVPDKDGTYALAGSNVTPPATPAPTSSTVSTPAQAKTPSAAPKKVQKTQDTQKFTIGNGYTVVSNDQAIEITLAKDVSIIAMKDATTATTGGDIKVTVTYDGANKIDFMIKKDKSDKEMADEIIEFIKKEPGQIFPAFDDAKGEYQIEAFPAFTFVLDDNTFNGGDAVTLTIKGDAWNGKQVPLPKSALTSRARLNGELLNYLSARMKNFYPCAFDGTMNVKTSIGKANTTLVTVEKDEKDKMGRAKLHTEISNGAFDWTMGGSQLTDKEISKNSVFDAMFMELPKIIPGWDDSSIDSRPLAGDSKGFAVEYKETTSNGADVEFTAYGSFSLNKLYDTGNIVFKMSVIDKRTGMEEPKTSVEILYNKAGIPVKKFLEENGKKIYKKYFVTSNMTQTLTQSAQAKVENKSKKIAFLSKIATNLKNKIMHDGRAGGSCNDLDFKIEQFDVNKNGVVTKVVIRLSDPDEILVTQASPDDWKNQVHFTKAATWAKLDKVDTTPKSLREYGVSALYTVTDIEEFSNAISLYLAESVDMLLEIFEGELIEVSESVTRKTISL